MKYRWMIATIGGIVICPGDWIITNGSETVVKSNEVFEKSYEPVVE